MRSAFAALLLGTTMLVTPAHAQDKASQQTAQSGPADLCHELLAFAEKSATEQQKGDGQGQAAAPSGAPPPRSDTHMSGTQGGGSVSGSSSGNTSAQSSAPPTAPVSPGAAPEAASSPHATDNAKAEGATQPGANESPESVKLAGGVTLQQVRETAQKGDRQACRDTTQKMRRAGGKLPADLLALAAYEPDPAKRK